MILDFASTTDDPVISPLNSSSDNFLLNQRRALMATDSPMSMLEADDDYYEEELEDVVMPFTKN